MEEEIVFGKEESAFHQAFETPKVEYDGHVFNGYVEHGIPAYIYLASKARHGDQEAAALLVAFKIIIWAAGGRRYWPPEAEVGEHHVHHE